METQYIAPTDMGFWLNVDVGIETWLGDHWSVGIAGRVLYAAMSDEEGNDISITGVGLALSFSASEASLD